MSASDDKTLKVWDVESGRELPNLLHASVVVPSSNDRVLPSAAFDSLRSLNAGYIRGNSFGVLIKQQRRPVVSRLWHPPSLRIILSGLARCPAGFPESGSPR